MFQGGPASTPAAKHYVGQKKMKSIQVCALVLLLAVPRSSKAGIDEMPFPFQTHRRLAITDYEGGGSGTVYLPSGIEAKKIQGTQQDGYDRKFDLLVFDVGGHHFTVFFSSGASGDPNYHIEVPGLPEFIVYCRRLLFGNEGNIYADGHTNSYFDARRRFSVTAAGIQETRQPFYYVNMPCKLTNDLVLTTEPCGKGQVVTVVPKKESVTVLLADKIVDFNPNYGSCAGEGGELPFLVVTPFGLVGWARTKGGGLSSPGDPLGCIYYAGD
jgi:hypothetical protein